MRIDTTTIARIASALGAFALVAIPMTGCAAEPVDDDEEVSEAFSLPSINPDEIPTENSWALAMIKDACRLGSQSLDGAAGSRANADEGVIYTATRDGQVVAKAWASSRFLWARKVCLTP